jgi:hypothetical protein
LVASEVAEKGFLDEVEPGFEDALGAEETLGVAGREQHPDARVKARTLVHKPFTAQALLEGARHAEYSTASVTKRTRAGNYGTHLASIHCVNRVSFGRADAKGAL